MKKIILLFIVVFCSSTLYSQKQKLEEAFVIFEKGDTLAGQILRKSERLLSYQIDFVRNDSIITIKPNEIKGIVLPRKERVYRTVPYEVGKSPKKYTKRIARLLVEGQVNLYKLSIPPEEAEYSYGSSINKVYIIQKDTSYYTLSEYEKIVEQSDRKSPFVGRGLYNMETVYSVKNKTYLGIMIYLFQDCPEITENISKAGFYDKDMISIIEKYNKCTTDLFRIPTGMNLTVHSE